MKNNIFTLGDSLKRGTIKRAAAVALAGSMLFSVGAMEASAYSLDKPEFSYSDFLGYNGAKIFINGRFVEFNKETGYPMSVNGTTYVPVSVVEKVFGAHIFCSSETNRVFMSKHGSELRLRVGRDDKIFVSDLNDPLKTRVNGTTKNQPFVSNGITYVPLREVFESFGCKVVWNGSTNSINVVSDYEKNSQYIDFKDENVLELKEVDFSKKYSKIIYDGQEVDADYLKLLMNSNEYKVIEQDNILYVFSYQYLIDVNYIYGVHTNRKNNLDNNDTLYKFWSISEKELEFARNLTFLDGYDASFNYLTVDMEMSGNVYSFMSSGNEREYSEVNKVVDGIVSRVKNSTEDPKKQVELVNNELCKLITLNPANDGEAFSAPSVYTALVGKYDVCAGYARAFKYIMDKLGIPCVYVGGMIKGTAIPHAWNEVYVDGEWKIVDVYTNDSVGRNKFLLTDMDDETWNKSTVKNEKDRLETELAKLTLKLNNNGKSKTDSDK